MSQRKRRVAIAEKSDHDSRLPSSRAAPGESPDRFEGLQAVYELTDAVARAVGLNDVCREAVRVARLALGADRVALLVADEAGIMRFRAWQGLSDSYRAGTEGHSPWTQGDVQAAPVVIEDVATDGSLGELSALVLAEGIAALAFIPLVAGGRLLGTFMLYYDAPHVFSDAELRLAGTIAVSVAGAIERRLIEQDLRSSREQLAAVFASVADGITVLDRGGRFVFANEAAAKMCGFDSAEQMLAAPTWAIMDRFEVLDEDGRPLDSDQLPGRRVLGGERYVERVLRYRRRGSAYERWSNVKATPICDDQGNAHLAVTVFRDISQERESVEREREARQAAELALGRLARLEKIADVALRASNLDELLAGLLETVRDGLKSDYATILLVEGTDELVVRAAVGLDEALTSDVRVPVGEGVAGAIAATRTARVIDDLSAVEVVSPYLRDLGGSLAGVPLLFRDRVLGVLHVGSERTAAFGVEDLEYLKLAAERAAIAIEQTRLFERERDIAAALQHSLLPEKFPRLPGAALAALYLPASDGTRVGGDWYDAFPVGDGRLILAIGDIVGHGIEAAAAMGQVRNALRAYAHEDPSPAKVFARLNKLLVEASGLEFCTAFCALVDPWAGTLIYTNAGHPAPLVLGGGPARYLELARSLPLGALADVSFEEATDSLEPGGVLFAYTDGLVERRDERLEARLDLLAREAAAAADVPLRRFPEAIRSKLLGEDTARLDDAAMIALQIASAEELHLRLPAEPASLAVMRRALEGFLARTGATADEVFDLKVACGEACANVIQHAYGTRSGLIRINAANTDRGLALGVRDSGKWARRHPRADGAGGRGLTLMRGLVDQLDVARDATGTEVTMLRRLGSG